MASKTILIQSEVLGRGDEKLGSVVMDNFLRILADSKEKPKRMVFWNTGVRLICEGSKYLSHLRRLEENGIEILACTKCLIHFNLMDKILVGKPTTMDKAVETIMCHDIVSL